MVFMERIKPFNTFSVSITHGSTAGVSLSVMNFNLFAKVSWVCTSFNDAHVGLQSKHLQPIHLP
jgi:hypothetical protein